MGVRLHVALGYGIVLTDAEKDALTYDLIIDRTVPYIEELKRLTQEFVDGGKFSDERFSEFIYFSLEFKGSGVTTKMRSTTSIIYEKLKWPDDIGTDHQITRTPFGFFGLLTNFHYNDVIDYCFRFLLNHNLAQDFEIEIPPVFMRNEEIAIEHNSPAAGKVYIPVRFLGNPDFVRYAVERNTEPAFKTVKECIEFVHSFERQYMLEGGNFKVAHKVVNVMMGMAIPFERVKKYLVGWFS